MNGGGDAVPVTTAVTVAAIAADVTAGRSTATSAVEACARRHDAFGRRLNALVQPRFDEARAEAAAFDAAPADTAALLLAGVPVSVKECFPVRGLTTTLGIVARRGAVDTADAAIVGRLQRAGAIVVGKANVPQAMYLHETDNPVWGLTRHPLAADRGPGGSSGGDAALVAAGVVPLGVGNDLAGSLRQPAHACGIVAVMPRTAALGDGGAFDTMPHLRGVRPRAGFLAATVADVALASAAVGVPISDRSLTRVGWWDDAGPLSASPAIVRGVREAVERLGRAGISTVRLDGGLASEAAWLLLAIVAADGGADVKRLFAGTRPMPGVRRLVGIAGLPRRWRPLVTAVARLAGRGIEAEGVARTGPRSVAELQALLAERETIATRFAALAAGCDAIICPVSALPALRHGTAARLVLAAAPCLLANLLDLPAGAVPITRVRPEEERSRPWRVDPVLRAAREADRGSRGLPVGVQVIGGPGRDESDVLAVMRLIESAAVTP